MYLSLLRLDGRTAFVTGGGRGIGLCTAEALAEAGARVIVSDVDGAVLADGIARLAAKGYAAEGVVLDVADSAAVEAAAAEANARHGAVDILVANAGIAWPDTAGEDLSDAAWRKVMAIDLDGAYWCCRAFGRAMLARGRGAIVTVGSMSGTISNKPQRQVHYNAAKAGLHHMTRSLAGEWAPRGVRVNCVAPTYVDTAMSRDSFTDEARMPIWMDMTPMRRPAKPEEIAAPILFLASDAASAMTGAVVPVDCGYTVW
ncbi:SDR family NAD(P)-dependent oxidoreductase [Oharaeibacter diazotrophicus]|uniref:NAD(P)-dependent dehydrogenase (Short-subunit alcohol dehydrogenase family) n=1 Tax=Oharaeibacter diazotrophicus TaxID=1920512 RepID=A0A4R6R5E9_9HYPH|nr:SDR family oxidoreductase [Oharaeibacter diazotrophicus]TDP81161.1 NAD(P)-dependent dehydrogenase (short-subunit alcohol dehydrogenase family) [Oharaeibacter diazotrophicus]BBE74845.1 3-oxoacyl-[acyl-carrier-protein] reductase FabG [Pleomorphomonas sp. SM30]GLS75651.1 oxidoreductase [Oharaeibacter diazotrophicus]